MLSSGNPVNTNRTKRRRHGYRGYGSPLRHEQTGAIHWGRGFAGVGFPEEGKVLSLRPDVIPEELRNRLSSEDHRSDSSD